MLPELHPDALWRYHLIEPMIQPGITDRECNHLVRQQTRIPVTWPSGRIGCVSKATLYRWIRKFKSGGWEALRSKAKPPPRPPGGLPPEQTEYAMALLEEDAHRSLFILQIMIQQKFSLPSLPSRSSLYRTLRAHPRYKTWKDLYRHKNKARRRWVTERVHQVWQLDGLGPFKVPLISGACLSVTVISILDDFSRFILGARLARGEGLAPLVGVFRDTALRYGLPEKAYADLGSAYDAGIFRQGLALLGVHRINHKARNPAARGKIERYHRMVRDWFIRELAHQPVRDLEHLQDLFDAFLDQIYHAHHHRELKMSIRQALGQGLSQRQVSLDDLYKAFLIPKSLVMDHTGSVRAQGTLFHVPSPFRQKGKKVILGLDPQKRFPPCLITASGERIALVPALSPSPKEPGPAKGPPPTGSLTPILERFRGRILPNAQGGFGLPEIYQELAIRLQRPIPTSELETRQVVTFLKTHGPFQPESFRMALERVIALAGPGRPLSFILEALAKEIRP